MERDSPGERRKKKKKKAQTVAHDCGEEPGGRGKAEREDCEAVELPVPLKAQEASAGRVHGNMMICTGQVARTPP